MEIVQLLLANSNIDVNITDILNAKKFMMFKINFLNNIWNFYRFMIFHFGVCNNTPLLIAIDQNYQDIINILLARPDIEINCKNIKKKNFFWMKFEVGYLNDIENLWIFYGIFLYILILLH